MTTVQTRARTIAELEGFDIIIKQNGEPVDPTQNGVLKGPYSYERKAKHTKTVDEWKRERFEAGYPGFTCDVLRGDGTTAAPQMNLRTVRESYEE
jgi:hypothetical protein